MSTYFSLEHLEIRDFERTESRFSEPFPGTEWRLVCEINLQWLEKVLQKAIAGPVDDEERLGKAVVLAWHIRAMLDGNTDDLRPDLFGSEF